MALEVAITPESLGLFKSKIQYLLEQVDDLRVPLGLIRESWFKGNRAIFALSSAGKFKDLSPNYKKRKAQRLGSAYPILSYRGLSAGNSVRSALVVPGSAGSIARFIGKKELEVGVDENESPIYGYLARGTSKMPARPFVLLGAEQVAPSSLQTREAAWREVIISFVLQKTGNFNG